MPAILAGPPTFSYFIIIISGSAAAVSDGLLTSLAGVVNLWLADKCPPVLGEFVASVPLTPLLKPDGGIRPTAIGTIWRRLCSKLAPSFVCKALTTYLGDHQFGVGITCGGEGIMHSANRLLELKGTQSNLSMLLIDFRNDFNLVSRTALTQEVRSKCPSIAKCVEFCYTHPTRLYYGESTCLSVILSSTTRKSTLIKPCINSDRWYFSCSLLSFC